MKQVLIEIDDAMARELERVAPARSRRRSEFIRAAIRRALAALQEEGTRRAYERAPDDLSDYAFDPRTWDPDCVRQAGGAGAVAELRATKSKAPRGREPAKARRK